MGGSIFRSLLFVVTFLLIPSLSASAQGGDGSSWALHFGGGLDPTHTVIGKLRNPGENLYLSLTPGADLHFYSSLDTAAGQVLIGLETGEPDLGINSSTAETIDPLAILDFQ